MFNKFIFSRKKLVLVKPDRIVSHVTYVNNIYDLVCFITECQIWAMRVQKEQQERDKSHTNATRVLHERRKCKMGEMI